MLAVGPEVVLLESCYRQPSRVSCSLIRLTGASRVVRMGSLRCCRRFACSHAYRYSHSKVVRLKGLAAQGRANFWRGSATPCSGRCSVLVHGTRTSVLVLLPRMHASAIAIAEKIQLCLGKLCAPFLRPSRRLPRRSPEAACAVASFATEHLEM